MKAFESPKQQFESLNQQAEMVSPLLKSLAHPTRLLIICRLAVGPCTVQELQEACGLEQAPTSQFLARLRAEGQIQGDRHGNQVVYSLVDPRLVDLIQSIGQIYCDSKRKDGKRGSSK